MKTKRKSWRDHEMKWVTGCITSQGAIIASATKGIRSHTLEESQSRRWRWYVWGQEFFAMGPGQTLTEEEEFAVCDWLIRRGYADSDILPEPKPTTKET
jgi:hypothetical protein